MFRPFLVAVLSAASLLSLTAPGTRASGLVGQAVEEDFCSYVGGKTQFRDVYAIWEDGPPCIIEWESCDGSEHEVIEHTLLTQDLCRNWAEILRLCRIPCEDEKELDDGFED